MKTVADIARELGVTPKTIYQRLNRVTQGKTESNTGLNGATLTTKQGGITFITEDGEAHLREIYGKVKPESPQEVKEVIQGNTEADEQILFLRAQLERANQQNDVLQAELNREREHSRTQSDKLSDLAEQLADIARNHQILLGAESARTNPALLSTSAEPTEDKPVKKKGFWSIFKKSE